MKYKPPKVEEYPDTDDAGTSKRKRDDNAPEIPVPIDLGEDQDATETQFPPTKAPRPSETPGDDELDMEEEDLADEDGDDGDIYEEYDQAQADDNGDEEGEDEQEEEDEEDEEEGGVVLVGQETDEGNGDEEIDEEEDELEEDNANRPKIHKAVERFGRPPLEGTSVAEKPLTASAETILAMVIDAMLKSRPISHDLSQRAVNKVIDKGYHDIKKLGDSSWEERTTVLKDGGYNRYREQGATSLGELAEFINGRYDGDLNNLWEEAHHDRARTRELVQEIKGLGDLGVDLFFNNVQSVWPSIAPFVDGRSLQTADQVGLGTDLDAIYAELEGDAMMMSRLANGLSVARLEKRQGELIGI
ncbi:hypothetical protein FE257_006563 [Aspergillus nanangensis]|uniref:Uncharacterized protein n=1 Tax=Aspergillus nanangensis TaxID=2582783 RepID=A0AAD4H0F8_ASPNN|nr:hypothetical protein FE257_006563 [Aspergillus nanangensis]